MRVVLAKFLLIAVASIWVVAAHANDIQVPFVGCPADGQEGPTEAPTGSAQIIHTDSALPGPIAYYKGSQDLYDRGVFAPAGWHCYVLYGSSGASIIVTSHPFEKIEFPLHPIDTPVIELSVIDGETSGRFGVARLSFMLFPSLMKQYIKRVEDEGLDSRAEIEAKKYKQDKLTYINQRVVKFETPANTKGLGTEGYIDIGRSPVVGVIGLSDKDGIGISILRASMGADGQNWNSTILKLNMSCVTSDKGC